MSGILAGFCLYQDACRSKWFAPASRAITLARELFPRDETRDACVMHVSADSAF